ncbi:hypothetical protein HY407_03315 [Candidatus Gottesmanbacteria bacterium]|nr:hypothetical protein [Candidatus Gottesmanbacteria bacterium]
MYRKEYRIPTLIGLFILLFGLGGGIFLLETSSNPLTGQADVTTIPANMHITNVSDSQFSISWTTAKATLGYISYTDNQSWLTIFDDRDDDGRPKNYFTHHVTLKNLKENSKYSFKIISGKATFDNDGNFYSQSTGPRINSTLKLNPSYGVVLQEDDKPAEGAIVYLTVGKSLPLSTIAKNEGTWLIPLTTLRSQDLLSRPTIGDKELVQISVVYDNSKTSFATTDIANVSPVPNMNLGKSYDFRNLQGKSKQPVLVQKKEEKKILGSANTNIMQSKIEFVFPDKETATTIDNKPEIRGIAIPGNEIVITINSTPQVGKVIVGIDGTWSFRPKNVLSPGQHTVSLSTKDKDGKLLTMSRKFTVLKSGESVLGDATPSATLIPTEFPTMTPFATIVPTISATPPVTASTIPTYTFLAAGIVFVLLGLKFLIVP